VHALALALVALDPAEVALARAAALALVVVVSGPTRRRGGSRPGGRLGRCAL